MTIIISALIGLASGITSGMFGVGGGIVMVPAMLYLLSPPIRDIKQAIGTSLAVIIPTAIVGTFKHHHSDAQVSNVHWQVVLWLAPTAILGSYLGAWIAKHHVDADTLKRLFGLLIILAGLQITFSKNPPARSSSPAAAAASAKHG
jgi:uncharacterized membrane protein YfcA